MTKENETRSETAAAVKRERKQLRGNEIRSQPPPVLVPLSRDFSTRGLVERKKTGTRKKGAVRKGVCVLLSSSPSGKAGSSVFTSSLSEEQAAVASAPTHTQRGSSVVSGPSLPFPSSSPASLNERKRRTRQAAIGPSAPPSIGGRRRPPSPQATVSGK